MRGCGTAAIGIKASTCQSGHSKSSRNTREPQEQEHESRGVANSPTPAAHQGSPMKSRKAATPEAPKER